MKKLILILLLFTGFLQGQTLQNPTYGNTTTNNLTVKNNIGSTDFDPLLSQDPATNITKKRILQPESTNLDPANFPIYGWGDSLTNGATQVNYPTQLTALLGWMVTNKGVGGETSTQIKNRMIADVANYSKSIIIWSGRNNTNFPTTIKSDIAQMVAALGHTRYLVLGILNRSDEPKGSATYISLVQLNADLKAIYGSKYVPIREAVVAAYNPSLAQDVIDHNNDVPPTSLRITSDPIHLNTAGYAVVASELYKRLGILYNQNGYLQAQNTEWYLKNSPSVVHTVNNESIDGIKTFINSPVISSETASTIASFDATKNIKSLSTATYPNLTELSYIKGLTSPVQTQLNGALLTSTDQSWTGIKASINTGATWINGLNLTNNGANWSSQVTNTSTGDGFRFINTTTASGAASTFFNQSNGGGTSAQYVQNNLAGRGVNGANYGSGPFLYIDSMTASTGNTMEIRKQGTLVTRFDSNGALRTPVPLFTTTPATAVGASDLLVFTSTSASLEKIPYTTFQLSIPQLEFNNTDLTVWNNGKANIASNTSFGDTAWRLNTTGLNGSVFGAGAGAGNTTGQSITAMGYQAVLTNSTASGLTGIGAVALLNATGDNNTGTGFNAGKGVTSGTGNSLFGQSTMELGNGTDNLMAGRNVGNAFVSGNLTVVNQSVLLGANIKTLANNSTNEIVIGYNGVGNGNNTATFGNTSTIKNYFNGTVTGGAAVLANEYVLKSQLDAAVAGAIAQTISSASTLTLSTTSPLVSYYVFTGTTATWTLPVPAGNTTKKLALLNTGTGTVTVNTNAGANVIYNSGSTTNTYSLLMGSTVELYSDGTRWIVL